MAKAKKSRREASPQSLTTISQPYLKTLLLLKDEAVVLTASQPGALITYDSRFAKPVHITPAPSPSKGK